MLDFSGLKCHFAGHCCIIWALWPSSLETLIFVCCTDKSNAHFLPYILDLDRSPLWVLPLIIGEKLALQFFLARKGKGVGRKRPGALLCFSHGLEVNEHRSRGGWASMYSSRSHGNSCCLNAASWGRGALCNRKRGFMLSDWNSSIEEVLKCIQHFIPTRNPVSFAWCAAGDNSYFVYIARCLQSAETFIGGTRTIFLVLLLGIWTVGLIPRGKGNTSGPLSIISSKMVKEKSSACQKIACSQRSERKNGVRLVPPSMLDS